MPRVILTERFDWRVPGKRAVMSWPPGEFLLTRAQADDAEKKGIVRKPVKGKSNDDQQ